MKEIIILILFLFLFSGCTEDRNEIGMSCINNSDCINFNCINNECAKSNLEGFCIENSHCEQGVCKSNFCKLGENGDFCSSNNDCNQKGFECFESKCVSNKWYCEAARFLDLGDNSILVAIFLLVIGIVGVYFGKTIIGANVVVGSVTIGLGVFFIAAVLGVFGIGIFTICY